MGGVETVAVLLIAVSLGIYQTYICYATGLFLMLCLLDLWDGCPLKEIFQRGGKYLLISGLGLALYLIVEYIALAVSGSELLPYQGMDSIGRLDFMERLSAIPRAYQIFDFFLAPIRLLRAKGFENNGRFLCSALITCAVAALALGAGLFLLIRRKIYRDVFRLAAILIGHLLIPLALNCIVILAHASHQHLLMEYSFALLPIWILKTCELSVQDMILSRKPFWKLSYYVLCAAFLCVCWKYFIISNVQYHHMQLNYENSFAIGNRIIARIEAAQEYPGQEVAFIGQPSGEQYGNRDRYVNYRRHIELFPLMTYKWENFFTFYIGTHVKSVNDERLEELQTNPDVLAMPVFPARNSVAAVDGVIVVKMQEIPPSS
ncbi:MAG: glucosyltransferase domain-containing protein [Oscillospiraceae bacterium]|nr:glucosyltransferase domain-containing protein [Oscillospiraceae bacterium]